ncbi:MAG: MATE family efflux transporter [Gammaproteobacteria bacterium]|jgi:O-antigen/teichoic acid export membrane protein
MKRLLQRYSHVNWALADQGMVSGASFLTGILLARYLGVDEFGVYTLGWLILIFIGMIHAPLIIGAMMSIGPAYPEAEAPEYYGAVIIQNLVIATVGTGLVTAGIYLSGRLFPEWGVAELLWPVAAATFAALWQDFFRRYFFTRGRPAVAFTIDAIRYLGQVVVLFVLFQLFPVGLNSGLAMWVTAGSAAIAAGVCPLVMGEVRWSREVTRSVAVRHYQSSKWVTASAPLEWISENAFIFAAGSIVGSAGVGAVRATQNIVGVAHILFNGLLNVVQVRAAKHYSLGGVAALAGYLRQVAWTSGSATAAVCLVFAIAPGFWLRLFYGEEFVIYGELVRWWALVYTVNIFILPLRAGLRALETTRPIFTSRVGAALFALVSAAGIIGWVGLEGAVIGILIAKTILVLSLWWLGRPYLGPARQAADAEESRSY